jgi:hypothetical protein
MPELFKNLGGGTLPPGGVLTDLYTVPPGTQTVVASVIVCNQLSTGGRFRISHAVGGAADTPSQYLAFDTRISPNDTVILTMGIGMQPGDKLRVQSNSGGLSFNATGDEIT